MNEGEFQKKLSEINVVIDHPERAKAQALKLIAATLFDINSSLKRTNKRLIRIIDNLEDSKEAVEDK